MFNLKSRTIFTSCVVSLGLFFGNVNFRNHSNLEVVNSIDQVISFSGQPAQAQLIDLMSWALNSITASVKRNVIGSVSGWLIDSAKSTTCIPGQNIYLVTHRINTSNMFSYLGYCFEPRDANARSFKNFTSQLSRKSGIPVVYGYYDSRYNQFVFGVPK